MYIVGKYYQGNPDQKPVQWGSVADVQYAVRANCEKFGIDFKNCFCAIPNWRTRQDYGVFSSKVTQEGVKFDDSYIHTRTVSDGSNIAKFEVEKRSIENIYKGEEFTTFFSGKIPNLYGYYYPLYLYSSNYANFYVRIVQGYYLEIISSRGLTKATTSVSWSDCENIAKNKDFDLVLRWDKVRLDVFEKLKTLTKNTDEILSQANFPNYLSHLYFRIKLVFLYSDTSSKNGMENISYFYNFNCVLKENQIEKIQTKGLFQPVSRPLYFDFTDLPVSPEYASVISEKVNTISEFQKEGFATSTLSEKTNLISGFEKQAEISSVVTETTTVTSAGTSTEFEEYSYTSDINEIIALNTEKEKTSYYASIINETASLSTEFEKNINHTSYINETIEITSYGSATESASYSSIINETASLSTEFEKNINHTSYINETIDLNSQAEKNINHVSDINEIIALNTEKEKTSYYASIINETVFLTSTTSSFEEYSYISKISEEIHSFSEGTKTFSENKEFFASVFLSSESFKMSEYSSFIQEYLVLSLKEEENLFIFVDGNTKSLYDGNTKSLYDGNTFNMYNGFIKEEK
jgi:hypothetical protein